MAVRLTAAALTTLGVGAVILGTDVWDTNNTSSPDKNVIQTSSTTEIKSSNKTPKLQTSPITAMRENTLVLTVSLKRRADFLRASQDFCRAVSAETSENVDTAVGLSARVWGNGMRESVPSGISVVPADFQYPAAHSPSHEDLCAHIKADSRAQLLEAAKRIIESLNPDDVAQIRDRYGLRLHQGKNWDGLTSPRPLPSPEIQAQTALIPEVGGSFLLVQRWEAKPGGGVSATPPFDAEAIVGRTLTLPDQPYACLKAGFDLEKNPRLTTKAVNSHNLSPESHVSRMIILDPYGEKIKIERQSVCSGTLTSKDDPLGMLYIAYANDARTFPALLNRMFGMSKHDAIKDAITSRYRLVDGQFFYVLSPTQMASFIK